MSDWARQHPGRIVVSVFLFLLGFAAYADRLQWFRTHFNQFVNSGTNIIDNHVEARTWFFVVFALLLIIATGCGALALQSEIKRREVIRARHSPPSLTTLNEVTAAVAAIRDRSFRPLDQPVHSLMRVKNTYLIHKDLTGEVHRYHEIRASDKPIHFYSAEISVAANAQPVRFLEQLSLKVTDEGDNDVACLPIEMDKFRKKLLLVFLPRIEPDEAQPRKLVLEYKWPGMWNQLKSDGQEFFSWTVESRHPVPLLEFEIYWDPQIGMALECTHSGPKYPNSKITGAYDQQRHWNGYRYQVRNGPAGRSTYGLLLKVRNA